MAPALSSDPVEARRDGSESMWFQFYELRVSQQTEGTPGKKRERQGSCEAERHILVQSWREWFHSTVSLNQRARENSSSQSFVFLNHTAWCVFPRRAVTRVYGHICAVWAEWNMSIPRPTGRPDVGNLANVPCKAIWSVLQTVQVMWKTMSFRNWLVLGLYEGLVSLVIALYNYASRIRRQSDIFI